jgi:hypothetical protein
MSTKEKQEQLVEILKNWQHVENASVAQTAAIIGLVARTALREQLSADERSIAVAARFASFATSNFRFRD